MVWIFRVLRVVRGARNFRARIGAERMSLDTVWPALNLKRGAQGRQGPTASGSPGGAGRGAPALPSRIESLEPINENARICSTLLPPRQRAAVAAGSRAPLLGGALFSQAGENDWFVPLARRPKRPNAGLPEANHFRRCRCPPRRCGARTQARTERAQAGRKNRVGRGRLLHLRRRRANPDRGLEPLSGRLAAAHARGQRAPGRHVRPPTVSAWPPSTAIRPRCRSSFSAGCATIKFSPSELDLLRRYVLRGGMIVADNIAGESVISTQSFREAMEKRLPGIEFSRAPGGPSAVSHHGGRQSGELPEEPQVASAVAGRNVCLFARRRAAFRVRAGAAAGMATTCRCCNRPSITTLPPPARSA